MLNQCLENIDEALLAISSFSIDVSESYILDKITIIDVYT
jgi:hypothetical protein